MIKESCGQPHVDVANHCEWIGNVHREYISA